MSAKKIGTRNVEALKPGEQLFDTEIRGFSARCLPSGKVQFSLRYRSPATGERRRVTIGLWGDVWTVDKARGRAKSLAGKVADKIDPIAEEQAKQAAATEKRERETLTVGAVCQDYFEGPGAKLRTLHQLKLMCEANVKDEIGSTSIYDLKRSDITAMLDRVEKRGPVMADRVLAFVRRVLNWHASRSDNFVSPIVKGMMRTKPKERARDRVLSPVEINAIWEGSKAVEPAAFGNMVQGLFMTACRRDELAAAQWAEIREDADHGKVLEIAGERVKNGKPFVVPLTPSALAGLPKKHEGEGRPFIYGRAGMKAFSGFSKSKRALDAAILRWMQSEAEKRGGKAKKVEPLPHWTLHDIRRTCRSILSAQGVSNDIAERCLGHIMQGVRGVYDRYDYLAEKRAALEKLANRIAIITSDDGKKVLPLKRA